MNTDEIIEACAEADHEVLRVYAKARGGLVDVPWSELAESSKATFRDEVKRVLNNSTVVSTLRVSTIRCMAAALEGTVVYPSIPAYGNQPEFPGETVDWSLPPRT